ncbi:dockerin type I domain-containing protein [Corallococcus sp. AB011P]|uniref:dockerin type I domain-containing protein n=1 Tax=Corallococcus sp. AB011P TaxID=2316735 RepID=UPI003518C020
MLAEESGGKMRVLDDTAPRPVYGDVNADGCVDMGDYDTVIQNFGLTVPPGDARADVNEDRTVDYGDYAVVMANWGMGGRCALPLRGE